MAYSYPFFNLNCLSWNEDHQAEPTHTANYAIIWTPVRKSLRHSCCVTRERQRERETDRQTVRQRERERRQPVKYNLCSFIFSGPARLYTTKITNMKTEEMTNMPRVRIAVLGKINVGKSGKCLFKLLWEIRKMGCSIYSINMIVLPFESQNT
jgi:hypothetical protein